MCQLTRHSREHSRKAVHRHITKLNGWLLTCVLAKIRAVWCLTEPGFLGKSEGAPRRGSSTAGWPCGTCPGVSESTEEQIPAQFDLVWSEQPILFSMHLHTFQILEGGVNYFFLFKQRYFSRHLGCIVFLCWIVQYRSAASELLRLFQENANDLSRSPNHIILPFPMFLTSLISELHILLVTTLEEIQSCCFP